jgi:predicted molibdopterin-dependent oxidoreductase YjgC
VPAAGEGGGFARDEAVRESGRCLRCDCRKADACLLRRYAERYGVGRGAARGEERRRVTLDCSHPQIVFEPAKCIVCGRCVEIARQAGERPGLAFLGRGADVTVGVPFGEELARALARCAAACAEACPTAALALRDEAPGRRESPRGGK